MRRFGARLLAIGLAGLLTAVGLAAGDDELRLEVQVSAEETGKPIPDAVVYVKYKEERFLRKDKKEEMSNKTNDDGLAEFPNVKVGKVLVQVVAKGWKTYGREYELTGPKQTVEIKLKPAKKWY